MITYINMPPRKAIIWEVLDAAKDAGMDDVAAACRRLLTADMLGWKKHHKPADWQTVTFAFEHVCRGDE